MSSRKKSAVSLVIPVYNEDDIIRKTVEDYHDEVVRKLPGSEILVVDDCSTDSTPEILKELEKSIRELRVLRTDVNSGHGRALRLGLENAKHELIFHTDSDYQHDPRDFWNLYEEIGNADLVIGYRKKRRDPVYRIMISVIVRLIILALFRYDLKDANSPFKLIREECLADCIDVISPDSFAPSILIVLCARHKSYRVREVPVDHFPRSTGKTSLGNIKIIGPCIRSLFDLFILKRSFTRLRKNGVGYYGR